MYPITDEVKIKKKKKLKQKLKKKKKKKRAMQNNKYIKQRTRDTKTHT